MFTRNKIALAAGALALAASGIVAARGTPVAIYGGGATLPAIAYVGTSWHTLDANGSYARLTVTPDAGSLFSQVAASAIPSYCQTGSGTGRKTLEYVANTSSPTGFYQADNVCGDYATTPYGFSAPAGQKSPNFAASDAPMAVSDYTAYLNAYGATGTTGVNHVEPVQFPAIVGTIAIAYNNANAGTAVNLTDAQLCGVFSGQITTWSGLGLPVPPNGLDQIYVDVRSDNSGTSFSFTNHLAAVCNSAGNVFSTNGTFLSSLVNGVPAGASITGASGNPGVVKAVASTIGAIGYAEYADALIEVPTVPNAQIAYATVNGYSAATTPSTKFLTSANLKADSVLSSTNNANGTPAVVTLASQGITPPVANCVYLIDPAAYANPTGVYPILAVSSLLGNQKGQTVGTSSTSVYKTVQALFKAPYNATYQSNTLASPYGAGYAFLPTGRGSVASTLNGRIASCIVQ